LRKVIIYTDGACSPNPGVGGWGVVMTDVRTALTKELKGGKKSTTSQKMELVAAIQALGALNQACEVILYTDSQYVKKGITEWIIAWKAGGWKKPKKHKQLWKKLDKLNRFHDVKWTWIPGHADIPGNERADELATEARKELAYG
jgi:ribonuclease HI